MPDAKSPLIGRTLDGRYRVEAVSARGGMATVFLATDLRLMRAVAVKVMHPELATDQQFVDRFVRESRAAAALAHPNVVAVHDQGQDAATGAVYIVMELVVGQTLRAVISERGSLSVAQALAVMDPVLLALDAAHRAGFVHRDVKPENVLISDDGQVKVADFGLARALAASDSHASTRGMLIGTAAYLSPEQVEHGTADARSDIYAAGVMLFELLTGQTPHQADTPIALAFQHVHADVPAPSTLNPIVPAALDAAVRRATSRKPADRFASAADFVSEIRKIRPAVDGFTPAPDLQQTRIISEQQPTTSRTAPSGRPAAKPTEGTQPTLVVQDGRKRRKPLRALAALLAVAGLVAGGLFWQSTRTDVPQLVGLTVAAAQQELEAAGLAASINETPDENIAEGIVISADPPSGSTVGKGEQVLLTVSSGPQLVAVPELAGLSEASAKTTLETNSLQLGNKSSEYSSDVPAGSVIRSAPAAGKELRLDSPVDLVISKGPAPIAIPSVKGLSESAAKEALRNAGFSEFSVTFEFSETVADGQVIATKPASGKKKLPDTVITIVVSKGPPPVEVPSVLGLSEQTAKSRLSAAGLGYRITWTNSCKPRKVVSTVVTAQDPSRYATVPKGTVIRLTMLKVCG